MRSSMATRGLSPRVLGSMVPLDRVCEKTAQPGGLSPGSGATQESVPSQPRANPAANRALSPRGCVPARLLPQPR